VSANRLGDGDDDGGVPTWWKALRNGPGEAGCIGGTTKSASGTATVIGYGFIKRTDDMLSDEDDAGRRACSGSGIGIGSS
jgi:hypothetical protein